jgi:ribosomal protein L32
MTNELSDLSGGDAIVVKCPNCGELVLIEEINCAIFRHGVLKKTGEQINPHSSKEECDKYFNRGLIYGCGKPFNIVFVSQCDILVEVCDYI